MHEIIQGDHALFMLINSTLSHPWLDWFFPAITDLHKTLPFMIIVPLLVTFSLVRAWGMKRGLGLFFSLLLTLAISDAFSTHALKKTIQRPRPPQTQGLQVIQRSSAGSYSFPSNHSVNTFAFAAFVTACLAGCGPWLYLIAALVAFSRIYNGVHFPLDVLAGSLLGLTFGSVFAHLAKRMILGRSPKRITA